MAIARKMFRRTARRAGRPAVSTPTTPEATSIARMSEAVDLGQIACPDECHMGLQNRSARSQTGCVDRRAQRPRGLAAHFPALDARRRPITVVRA